MFNAVKKKPEKKCEKIIKFTSITTTGHPRFETVRRSREKPEVYKWKIVNTTLGA